MLLAKSGGAGTAGLPHSSPFAFYVVRIVTLNTRSPRNLSLLLIGAAACWGFGTVVTKHALIAAPPFTLAVLQLAASSLFLLGIVLFRACALHGTGRPVGWRSLACSNRDLPSRSPYLDLS